MLNSFYHMITIEEKKRNKNQNFDRMTVFYTSL